MTKKNEMKYLTLLLRENNEDHESLMGMYSIRAKQNENFLNKIIEDFVELEINCENKKRRELYIQKRIKFIEIFSLK